MTALKGEPRPVLCRIFQGCVGDKAALRADYLDELLRSGGRQGAAVRDGLTAHSRT
ncbi:hypothetical protein ACSCBZ_15885 [Streptomyces niveiscabiei]|uniref:hypothetical protein n=1 Tax=Streptomyces TaxID=1883 RepID=UPI000A453322|nr:MULTISPECIES: hypothetical protein [Streptomyces]